MKGKQFKISQNQLAQVVEILYYLGDCQECRVQSDKVLYKELQSLLGVGVSYDMDNLEGVENRWEQQLGV